MLTKKKTELRDDINIPEESKRLEGLSVTNLKRILTKTTKNVFYFEYIQQLIDEIEEAQRFGNVRAYKSVFGRFKELLWKEEFAVRRSKLHLS